MADWIYLDRFKKKNIRGYRVSLPDGKKLDYYLDEGEIDEHGTIGYFGIRNDTQAPVVMGRNKGNVAMRFNKVLNTDLVYLAGQFRTGVFDRTRNKDKIKTQ
jgi:hypothetical protein